MVVGLLVGACWGREGGGGKEGAGRKGTSLQNTPRYLNRYLKAKQGIDEEEAAIQRRLHEELFREDQHLRGIAHVLDENPAKTRGVRLPSAAEKHPEVLEKKKRIARVKVALGDVTAAVASVQLMQMT